MKVLIVNTNDSGGGAAIAAYSLHRGFLLNGIESRMLVNRKLQNDTSVYSANFFLFKIFNRVRPKLDLIPNLLYPKRTKTLFSSAWLKNDSTLKYIEEFKPDIVNLHWVNGGMMSIEQISKIKVPIIITLHDNWFHTGGCHLIFDCDKYIQSCGSCPSLKSNKEVDLSRRVYLRKKATYKSLQNLTLVSVSNWLNKKTFESSLLKDFNKIVIPNSIDTNLFKPLDKAACRKKWNLPLNKKILLFGGINSTDDPNKGYHLLIKAINNLEINDVEIVVFGNKKNNILDTKFKTHFLGFIPHDEKLVSLLNCADVFITPSKLESFSLASAESMSCGIPVVAFNTSGIVDVVDHMDNGYLAKSFDPMDLKDGILWVLKNINKKKLSICARKKVIDYFSISRVVKMYSELFKKTIN